MPGCSGKGLSGGITKVAEKGGFLSSWNTGFIKQILIGPKSYTLREWELAFSISGKEVKARKSTGGTGLECERTEYFVKVIQT